MWFRSLFDTLFVRSSYSRSPKRRAAPSIRRRIRRFRPLLETLEDRTLLSTYVVDSLTDTGTGSGLTGDLRYCITNATSGNDTITFAQGLTGTIQLQSALPTLNASVDIQGPGRNSQGTQLLSVEQALSSSSSFGIFAIGSTAKVEISGLGIDQFTDGAIANAGTLTLSACDLDGNSTNSKGGGAITNSGTATVSDCYISSNGSGLLSAASDIDNTGTMNVSSSLISEDYSSHSSAIANSGVLTLNYCSLVDNTIKGAVSGGAGSADARGAAIFNQGTLTINNSGLVGNHAQGVIGSSDGAAVVGSGMGGAIYMSAGTLSINSSTLADNQAYGGSSSPTNGSGFIGNGQGGGLYIAGGTVSINNSTIADNQASVLAGLSIPGDGYGGGIYNAAGSSALQMYDTILADNSANTADPDLDGGVTSLGHNLIGNSTGGSGFEASDLLNVNPQLGPLQSNGGPTATMALLAGSPAIDAGDNTNAPAYDQRGPGFARIVGGTIDIGAFEVQAGTSQGSFAVSGFPTSTTAGNAGSFTVTALNADGSTDTSYTGTVQFTSSDPQAILPANYTFMASDSGVHTFNATLKTAGTQSITATDITTGSSGSDTGITVTPAAASTLSVTGFPTSTTAGVAHNFTVTLRDPYGNIATGYTGTVHFTSSDGKATLPANYTFTAADAGVHTFSATMKTAGTQSITATDTTTASLTGTEGGIQVNPAAASKFLVTAPASVRPGVPFSLTVTVEDAYGNVVVGYTGTIHFSSTDPRATLPANYTFSAANAGVHTFTGLVLRKRGYQKISVSDVHNSALTGNANVDVL